MAQHLADRLAAVRQDADFTAGHGIVPYRGLIGVSAPINDDLDPHVTAIERAAIHAACETQLLVGQQAAPFTTRHSPLPPRVGVLVTGS